MRRTLGSGGILVSGLLMVAGAFAHAFAGWPQLAGALREGGADPHLVVVLGIGWVFGSIAMVAMGLVAIVGFFAIRRGGPLARGPGLVVGATYLAFGIGAFIYRFPNPHFLFFIVLGLLLSVSLLASPRT